MSDPYRRSGSWLCSRSLHRHRRVAVGGRLGCVSQRRPRRTGDTAKFAVRLVAVIFGVGAMAVALFDARRLRLGVVVVGRLGFCGRHW